MSNLTIHTNLNPLAATAIIQGKVVKFRLSPALGRAQKRNAGKTLGDMASVKLVEAKRRASALRGAQPCENPPNTLTLRS